MSKKSDEYPNLKPFKKGQSGNPKGKPKGTRSLKTVISEIMEQTANMEDFSKDDEATRNLLLAFENLYGKPPTRREFMIFQITRKAMKGDTFAFSVLADREEGKPKQVSENHNHSYESYLDDNAAGGNTNDKPDSD